jgi:Ala-tRNA(Pro) deacylase
MKQKIYSILNQLNIEYKIHSHEAVFTCEQSEKYFWHIKSWKSKNLFLRNNKGTKFILISIEDYKKIDLKELWSTLWIWRLWFATKENLENYLWISPGSVWAFALINNEYKNIEYFIDSNLIKSDKVYFHPNDNTETLEIKSKDLIKFLEFINIKYTIINL